MASKYMITSPAFEGGITLEYNENGFLVAFKNDANLNIPQEQFFYKRFPENLERFKAITGLSSTLVVREVLADTSFNNFWELYGYKIGKKARAETLFNALTEAEKAKVFIAIPGYKYFLACKKNQDQAYPETFLNKRAFETDWQSLARR
jgi:hypothetical protein